MYLYIPSELGGLSEELVGCVGASDEAGSRPSILQ